MGVDDEYEGGPDQLAEKMAELDEVLAEQRAQALRQGSGLPRPIGRRSGRGRPGQQHTCRISIQSAQHDSTGASARCLT